MFIPAAAFRPRLTLPRELDDFYYYDRVQHLFNALIRGKWRRYIFDSMKSKF